MTAQGPGIGDLDGMVEALPEKSRKMLQQILQITTVQGEIRPPDSMLPWIVKQFGSTEGVIRQKVIKVTNLVTCEGAIFNPVRALRPRRLEDRLTVEARLIDDARSDPLNHPFQDTPEDLFGRIQSKHCVTASNVAKYDGFHGMIIFDHHNPLGFTRDMVLDYLETGWQWAQKAHEYDPSARYYFFLWNCLQRAGATLAHGHCQVVLGRGQHYAKIDSLRRAALRYRAEYGSDYFSDLFRVHADLGLAFEKEGTRVISYLTPIKEKEVVILAPALNASLKDRVHDVLACFRDDMQVTAFNLGLATPPLAATPEDWTGFPVVVRLVDRGYPSDGSSDFGTMELFAASVISSDPFNVARCLKDRLDGRGRP